MGKCGQCCFSLSSDSSDSNVYTVSICRGKWAALHEDPGFYLLHFAFIFKLACAHAYN